MHLLLWFSLPLSSYCCCCHCVVSLLITVAGHRHHVIKTRTDVIIELLSVCTSVCLLGTRYTDDGPLESGFALGFFLQGSFFYTLLALRALLVLFLICESALRHLLDVI